ncbi:mitochondrial intermembrane space import and assembly protein 40 [Sigmodon hispidus]
MDCCLQDGKDQIIFVTREDHKSPKNAEPVVDNPNEPHEEYARLIRPTREINWHCPCFEGMASGPCGGQFRSAFCFHYSTDELKGSDCIDQIQAMQECMQKYPDIYPQEKGNKDKDDFHKDDKGEEEEEVEEEEEEDGDDYYMEDEEEEGAEKEEEEYNEEEEDKVAYYDEEGEHLL